MGWGVGMWSEENPGSRCGGCIGKCVLVADDSQSSRDLLRFILEQTGCQVIEAQDGDQALKLVAANCPDLVVLDLNMRGRDGYSVAAELRANVAFAQMPMVALTAGPAQTDHASLVRAGFSTFLSKPIAPSRFRACIQYLLCRPAAKK